jgi:6-phosphogluconolactonase
MRARHGALMDLRVLDDPAAAVARMLTDAAVAGQQIVLTGGSTPGKAYEAAAAAGVDWSAATLWFGDERCVAPDDDRSNAKLAHDTLISRLPEARRPEVLRMEGELGPQDGAAAYETLVRDRLGEVPAWDLLLLGLGPDSHCASLFPDKGEKDVTDRLVVGVPEAGFEPYVPRISLTLPALNAAKRVVFLVTGAAKAEAMRRAFGDPPDPASPAGRVRPAGELLVVCDPAAAGGLQR